ncbi:MAG: FixH family protein [Deltaproteobacteria bacterium]|nr:FixH family protein [Deltaproteobacteria bacterium]
MLVLLVACTDAPDSADSAGAADTGDSAEVTVCGDLETDTWSAGISRAGATYDFVLVASEPDPPDKGDNVLTVRVEQGGAGVGDLTVTLEPVMPEHGHGTNPAVVATAGSGDGSYVSESFNLFMGGVWQYTVNAAGSSGSDSVDFLFCIEG